MKNNILKFVLVASWEQWITWWDGALAFFSRQYVYYYVKVNGKAKCPACGVRSKHKIQFHAILRILIHTCARCTASWGERPVFAADHWAPLYEVEEKNEADDISLEPPSTEPLARKRVN